MQQEVTMFKNLQKIGKSFMLPIAILPAAGLLLGIGGALSNTNTINAYPFLNIPILQGMHQLPCPKLQYRRLLPEAQFPKV